MSALLIVLLVGLIVLCVTCAVFYFTIWLLRKIFDFFGVDCPTILLGFIAILAAMLLFK